MRNEQQEIMKEFEIHTEYIKRHKIKNGNVAMVSVDVDEDYDPRTDGFSVSLLSFLSPLSLPIDNHGKDDISTLTESLMNMCNEQHLKPGTSYTVRMVKCEESDGWPHMMTTWGIESVDERSLYEEDLAT